MGATADPISYYLTNRSTVLAFLCLVPVLLVGAALVRPRPRLAAAATAVSLAAVLALTLSPVGGWSAVFTATWDWHGAVRALVPTHTDLTAWHRGADGPLNVALFVPLGALFTLLIRRPVTALVACVALSGGIELCQAATGLRIGTAADVVSNSLGALIGAALGGVLLMLTPVRPRRPLGAGFVTTSAGSRVPGRRDSLV